MIVTTYSAARANLASLMDKAIDNCEEVRIHRRGRPDVVLIAADELDGLRETAYLLRSPANAERLLAAIERVRRGEGVRMTVDELRHEVSLDDEEA